MLVIWSWKIDGIFMTTARLASETSHGLLGHSTFFVSSISEI